MSKEHIVEDDVPDDVWINLKILASLKTQMRLNTGNKLFYHESESTWTSLRRSFTGCSRQSTVDCIDELVMTCQRALQQKTNPKLIKHLQNARLGIQNLKKTYCGDATTQASIDRLLDKIDVCLS